MNIKITGRDIRIFLFGVFAALIFVIIYDWKDFKRGFADGFEASRGTHQIEQKH